MQLDCAHGCVSSARGETAKAEFWRRRRQPAADMHEAALAELRRDADLPQPLLVLQCVAEPFRSRRVAPPEHSEHVGILAEHVVQLVHEAAPLDGLVDSGKRHLGPESDGHATRVGSAIAQHRCDLGIEGGHETREKRHYQIGAQEGVGHLHISTLKLAHAPVHSLRGHGMQVEIQHQQPTQAEAGRA
eukprot:scaffold26859_cov134-Isochrysis_galbana.AAC.2